MRRLALLPLLVLLAACGDAADAPAPEVPANAGVVADAMLERYRSNQEPFSAFVVRGGGAVARYTRNEADTTGLNPWILQVEPAGAAGAKLDPESVQLLYNHVPNVPRLADALRGAEVTAGAERNGRPVYVLFTDDPGALLGDTGQPGDHHLRVSVDAETYDVLEIYQSVVTDSTMDPVTTRLLYEDFETTDGLTLPRTVRQITTGVNQYLSEEAKVREMGNIGLERARADRMPAGPERDRALALVDRQERIVGEGVAETTLEVEGVSVTRPGDDEPAP